MIKIKQEKLDRIYKVIGYNPMIQDYTFRLSDEEWNLKWIMIGDVLDMYEIDFKPEDFADLIALWKYKRKPIEDQPIKCINFISSFIEDE